jgi:hypothetical protein
MPSCDNAGAGELVGDRSAAMAATQWHRRERGDDPRSSSPGAQRSAADVWRLTRGGVRRAAPRQAALPA